LEPNHKYYTVPKVLKRVVSTIEDILPGSFALIPSGWIKSSRPFMRQHLMFVVERLKGGTSGSTDSLYRLAVCNPEFSVFHPRTAEFQPKLKMKPLVLHNIPKSKITDPAFWLFVLNASVMQKSPTMLYDKLLPWLVDMPLENQAAETWQDPDVDWRTPTRSATDYHKCLHVALRYILRRRGATKENAKFVSFSLRLQMLLMAENDLEAVKQYSSVKDSDIRLLKIACGQLASSAVKMSDEFDGVSPCQLRAIHVKLNGITQLLATIKCDDAAAFQGPPPAQWAQNCGDETQAIEADSKLQVQATWALHPFFDRLKRRENEGEWGAMDPPPKQLPLDMLGVRDHVETFVECLQAISRAEIMCARISYLQRKVKHSAYLKVAVIQHLFVQTLPVPMGPTKRELLGQSACCPWTGSQEGEHRALTRASQLHALALLQKLTFHFASAAFSIKRSRSFDAVKVVVSAMMATIADALLRQEPHDHEGELGRLIRAEGYGPNIDVFEKQSETLDVSTQELNIQRTGILDYWQEVKIDDKKRMFNWEEGGYKMYEDPGVSSIMGELGKYLYLSGNADWNHASGRPGKTEIIDNFPDWPCYRDIFWYWKYMMCTDPKGLPPCKPWSPGDAVLDWSTADQDETGKEFDDLKLFQSKLRKMVLADRCSATGLRYTSNARAFTHTEPHVADTEDDILHIRNLPNFDGVLNQEESEMLLSYLIVPYLRVPLILNFFASEERFHALTSVTLRETLHAVLFEPGKYLSIELDKQNGPKEVPAEEPALLATACGILLSELMYAHEMLFESTMQLLKMSMMLSTKNHPRARSVPVILFVLRLGARVLNAAYFLVMHAKNEHPSIRQPLRGLSDISADTCLSIERAADKMQKWLLDEADQLLQNWGQILQDDSAKHRSRVDANSALLCNINAHRLLIYRNLPAKDLTQASVSSILGSFMYLSSRHTWNQFEDADGNDDEANSDDEDDGSGGGEHSTSKFRLSLDICETELFEIIQIKRRALVEWLNDEKRTPKEFSDCLNAVYTIATGTADVSRGDGGDFVWGKVRLDDHRGRYGVCREESSSGEVQWLDEGDQKVELNLQTMQIVLRGMILGALEEHIASESVVKRVFSEDQRGHGIQRSIQCVSLGNFKDMQTRYLVNEGFRLSWW
jgi:hypothetical protein